MCLVAYLCVLDGEVRTGTFMLSNSRKKSYFFCHSTAENNWASTRTCVAAAVDKGCSAMASQLEWVLYSRGKKDYYKLKPADVKDVLKYRALT